MKQFNKMKQLQVLATIKRSIIVIVTNGNGLLTELSSNGGCILTKLFYMYQ